MNSKINQKNASILLSINTENKSQNEERIMKTNINSREHDSPIKERLLTLSNQNYNYGNLHTHNSNHNRNYKNSLKTNENTILNTGINLVSPRKLYNNYKSFNDMKSADGKYKENYHSTVVDLKDKLENSFNFHMQTKSEKTRNSPKGFKFYEIPHINSGKPTDNYRINLLWESLEKSIKYHKSNVNMENLDEIIGEENNRLKMFKNSLDAFTEINSPKHPNLNQITKMTKLKESSLRICNSRFMGPKYDPHNFSQ